MTQRIGNVVIIAPEPDGVCELCGKIDELRPYGPDGKNICYDCGMLDEEGTMKRMTEFFGDAEVRYEDE